MPYDTATGLVVRGTDFSETSRIVTLFTRHRGRVRALAKGGRRLKSGFEVALDLLTVCQVVFIPKAGDALHLLTEARIAERFPHLRTDLPSLFAGYYLAELLADGTQDDDPHPALFDAALAALRSPLGPAAVAGFEVAWLRELGYSPRLDGCAVCGRVRTGPATGPVTVSPSAGGLVCRTCRRTSRDGRPLSPGGLEALAAGPPLPPAFVPEVRAVLADAVAAVLGRRPKTAGFLAT
jgi:DNA repair protein RecO (recombination protein O)